MAARRTREAARARAEAESCSTLAGQRAARRAGRCPRCSTSCARPSGFAGVTLLERDRRRRRARTSVPGLDGAGGSRPPSGDRAVPTPGEGDAEILVDDELLAWSCAGIRWRPPTGGWLEAFAAQAAVALRQRAAGRGGRARPAPLAEADRLRTALLVRGQPRPAHAARLGQGGGRTGLRSTGVDWSARRTATELLATAEESLDQLHRLVDNLLDMSRLQAGALAHDAAADRAGRRRRRRRRRASARLARRIDGPAAGRAARGRRRPGAARTDPGQRRSPTPSATAPPGQRALGHGAASTPDRVEIRVIDRGPGIPAEQWDEVFLPFQRLGDRDNSTGVGLGLALSRGLAEAMGGHAGPGRHTRRRAHHDLRLPCAAAPP